MHELWVEEVVDESMTDNHKLCHSSSTWLLPPSQKRRGWTESVVNYPISTGSPYRLVAMVPGTSRNAAGDGTSRASLSMDTPPIRRRESRNGRLSSASSHRLWR